jgi:urease accessory protein
MRPYELLVLLQVTDSAFPAGCFAHSLGLEAAHAAGDLRDPADLERLVHAHLGALATSDLPAVRSAHGARALEELVRLDRELAATKPAREAREAATATGRRLLVSLEAAGLDGGLVRPFHAAVRRGEAPGTRAVAHGVGLRAAGVELGPALHAYAHGAALGLVLAAQRLVPLGGGAAQRALHALAPALEEAVARGSEHPADDLHAFAPLLDVRAMEHERQRVRLFIS